MVFLRNDTYLPICHMAVQYGNFVIQAALCTAMLGVGSSEHG